MLPIPAESVVERLRTLQARIRDELIRSREKGSLHSVTRSTAADTIYELDAAIEPVLEEFCVEWSRTTPLVLVAEGVLDHEGREGSKTFPQGLPEHEASIRLLVDPIDGTRGIMYDKRAAWSLAGVATNRGPSTRLRDIEAAVMTELPTSKMGRGDVLWAIKGGGAYGERIDLAGGRATSLSLNPSGASGIDHGFATVSNFFPGTKVLAAELMEYLVRHLVGPADVTRATVFDDQYISTGGQFYELIIGHDRFNADLRPLFYRMQGQPEGLCCHPYDCATMLVAQEAGVVLTDETGAPLDGPMDVTTGINWVGYANPELRQKIEPLLKQFDRERS
jgi:fructose-1,6-bisphosphatase/inositol monophosphatase family enzyme